MSMLREEHWKIVRLVPLDERDKALDEVTRNALEVVLHVDDKQCRLLHVVWHGGGSGEESIA